MLCLFPTMLLQQGPHVVVQINAEAVLKCNNFLVKKQHICSEIFLVVCQVDGSSTHERSLLDFDPGDQSRTGLELIFSALGKGLTVDVICCARARFGQF